MNFENGIVKITEKSPHSTSNLSWAGVALFKDNRIFKKIDELSLSNTGEYEITEAIAKVTESKEQVIPITLNNRIIYRPFS